MQRSDMIIDIIGLFIETFLVLLVTGFSICEFLSR